MTLTAARRLPDVVAFGGPALTSPTRRRRAPSWSFASACRPAGYQRPPRRSLVPSSTANAAGALAPGRPLGNPPPAQHVARCRCCCVVGMWWRPRTSGRGGASATDSETYGRCGAGEGSARAGVAAGMATRKGGGRVLGAGWRGVRGGVAQAAERATPCREGLRREHSIRGTREGRLLRKEKAQGRGVRNAG